MAVPWPGWQSHLTVYGVAVVCLGFSTPLRESQIVRMNSGANGQLANDMEAELT